MSNSSAIGSVTAALFHLLSKAGVSVTTLPPDEVSAGSTDQLNLYLYGTEVHAAFRNEPMRGTVPPGQPGVPPLALVLRYLLTSYGDNEDFSVHEAMGKGMLVFHDHPILNKSQIDGLVPDGQLTGQVEKIKITPIPMSLDDMSKLWTSFQTEYRLSAAYEVSVVLIESEKAAGAPLPVLRRGEEDQGATVLPSPAPQITGFRFPHSKPAANLGDTVTLLGEHLSGQGLAIRFEHPELEDPIELEPHEQVSAGELTFRIPA
ncbi:MAG: DUF4255 domain-containing protein, partial [Gammaproteobacteria bacterium]|nr:DUF4255 domain-containing protein [Gammaproteobacteria bacterium]